MRELRISLAAVVTILISVGVIMIYSSSGVYALEKLGSKTYFLNRHLIFLVIGILACLLTMSFDYRILATYAKPMILVTFLLLLLVLVPHIGHASFGARRWFKIGPISFQPSELMKIVALIYTADFLARKGSDISKFLTGLLPLMLMLGVTCLMIIKQPDLGNSVLIASSVLILAFVAGARILHLLMVASLSIPLLAYLIISEPYRLRRIVAFLDPWQDSQGVGFQLSQSQIALGSGGFFGVGPGHSVQKLFYLPAAHTDFIFSIIGEEFGLIGTIIVIFLFLAFIVQGARIVKRTTNPFGYFLGLGIVLTLSLQTIINIGVSIGAFPTKGLPLPFVSYGGSALVFNMIAVGLLLNISRIEDL